ncbi:hypothetical protein OG948_02925 [Embleya sp. NBC_00888]|uniref:hypothetical protein n=1 Tax=Embleya sp. NBC_00888 TaxID=2975960 RepID=UPI003863486E|nr:hypothetical protein OG948_02925 [Embleya sp. NBC_00888]
MPDDRGSTADLVLLIHGTGAHDKAQQDEGPRWWQRGSSTWRTFDELLPDHVELPSEGRLFHWSGRNAQSHRYASANRLLATLIRLECQGRAYHLVGHSHGGSLIWEALLSAQVIHASGVVPSELATHLVNEELPGDVPESGLGDRRVVDLAKLAGLRSWTTVGTPFLTYRTKCDPREESSVTVSVPAPDPGRRERLDADGARGPTFLGCGFGVAAVGLFGWLVWINRDDRTPRSVLTSGCGLTLCALIVLMLLCAGGCAVSALYRRTLSESLAEREKAAEVVFARRGNAWLGLWAEGDEAIAGLRRALWVQANVRRPVEASSPPKALEVPFEVPTPIALVELAPEVSTHRFRVFLRLLLWAANRLAPWWTRNLYRGAVRKALGQDVHYTRVVSVNPLPLPGVPARPGLPHAVQARMEVRSAERVARIAPVLRRLLAPTALVDTPSPDPLVGANRDDLASAAEALLHTSYFEDPDVCLLIAAHIRHHASRPPGVEPPPLLMDDPLLDTWLRGVYEHARAVVPAPEQRNPARSKLR